MPRVDGTPLIAVTRLDEPEPLFAAIVLEPHVLCDGTAVLVPLQHAYKLDGESPPVRAAVIDRAGHMKVFDLDARVDGELDVAAVRRKIAAANAQLLAQCWREMPHATPQTIAVWRAPTLTVTHRGAVVRMQRPDLVDVQHPDTDCRPTDQVKAVFVDEAQHLGLVRIDHVMTDNCGSDDPSWVIVGLPST